MPHVRIDLAGAPNRVAVDLGRGQAYVVGSLEWHQWRSTPQGAGLLTFLFSPSVLSQMPSMAGLDPLASRHLKELIRRECSAGKTFVITSHILSEVQGLADFVVFLLEGRIRFQGTTEELLRLTGEDFLEAAVAELMERGQPPGEATGEEGGA